MQRLLVRKWVWGLIQWKKTNIEMTCFYLSLEREIVVAHCSIFLAFFSHLLIKRGFGQFNFTTSVDPYKHWCNACKSYYCYQNQNSKCVIRQTQWMYREFSSVIVVLIRTCADPQYFRRTWYKVNKTSQITRGRHDKQYTLDYTHLYHIQCLLLFPSYPLVFVTSIVPGEKSDPDHLTSYWLN